METVTVIQLTRTTFNRLLSTDCQRPAMNGSEKNQSNPCIAHNSLYIQYACGLLQNPDQGKRLVLAPVDHSVSHGVLSCLLLVLGAFLCELSCMLFINWCICLMFYELRMGTCEMCFDHMHCRDGHAKSGKSVQEI